MPKDKNIVIIEGIVGTDAKFGKTTDGKEYFTCSLSINSFFKDMADSTERSRSQTYIRVFSYDKAQVEYLHKMNVRPNQRMSVFGRLSSFMNEHRGNKFLTNSVVCRDIEIIKTKQETK